MQYILAICCTLVLGGIVAIVIVLNRRNSTPYVNDPPLAEKDPDSDMTRKVVSMKRLLKPWSGRAASGLTFSMEYRYIRSASDMITGKLFMGEEPVVAFHCVLNDGSARLAATTSDDEFLFGIVPGKTTVLHNGAPLGEISPGGILYGPDGLKIGHAQRSGMPGSSYTFHSYETPLATFATYSRIHDLQQDEVIRMTDDGKVFRLHATPSPTNEKWLLALAVLEATYHRFAFGEKKGKTVYGGRWQAMNHPR